jgi:hypothetical protein
MKRTFFGLVAFLLCGWATSADAAAGWTDFGTISTFEQDGANSGSLTNEVFVVVAVSTNPSGCTVPTGFYMSFGGATQDDIDRKKRLFALLMVAQTTARPIRFYVTGTCHSVGYAEFDGIVISP